MKRNEDETAKKLRWLSYLAVALLIIGVVLLILNPTGTTIQMDMVTLEQLFVWRN